MFKKIVFIVSILLNFFFLLLFLFGLAGATSSFAFLNHGGGYFNSAFIVSSPLDSSDVNFGPVDIVLNLGSTVYLQFSVIRDGKQSNMAIEPLYDHSVIDVGQSGFGLVIKGVNPGEAVLQLFSPSGFKDIANVTVY